MKAQRSRGTVVVKVVAGIVAFGAVGGGLIVASQGESSAVAGSDGFGVAERLEFEVSTLAGGELEAKDQIELRSQLERESTVIELIDEGVTANEGDVLVRFNADEIEKEIADEELNVEAAKLELEAAQTAVEIQNSDNDSQLRKAQLQIELKTLALDQWREGEDKKKRQEQGLAIERAERELERLTDKWEQTQQLYEKEFVSKNEYDQDRLKFIEAKAELDKARLTDRIYREYQFPSDEKQKQSDLDEARAELERVQQQNEINLKSKESALTTKQRRLLILEERLAEHREQLEYCTIVAPQSGMVVYGSTANSDDWRWRQEGPLSIGRRIRPNDLVIVLPDTSNMVASVKVHESMAGRIQPGQRGLISVEAAGIETPGEVLSIGLLAEGGNWRDPNRREYTVKIALQLGAGQQVKPSMRCEARITLDEADGVLAVPVPAVFNEGVVRYVLVPSGSKLERRPVKVGRRSDMHAEILAGVEEGDRVLVRDPMPGVVLNNEWDLAELEAAGYELDEDGNPTLKAPARGGPPAGAGAGAEGRATRPSGSRSRPASP